MDSLPASCHAAMAQRGPPLLHLQAGAADGAQPWHLRPALILSGAVGLQAKCFHDEGPKSASEDTLQRGRGGNDERHAVAGSIEEGAYSVGA